MNRATKCSCLFAALGAGAQGREQPLREMIL
jgi:hypothetical protein